MSTSRRVFLASLTAVSLAPALAQAAPLRKGSFTGPKRYKPAGQVEVTDSTVSLQRDFCLGGAPDPVVGLGNDGRYDPATFMGELKATEGASSYSVPDGVDVSKYNEVHVWCRRFNTKLSVAEIS